MLTFHLAGINNQNFIMRDDETGSFWQQISGKAISGPLAGQQLDLVKNEELTFGLWRSGNPRGTVLLPVPEFEKHYEPKDWEKRIMKAQTVVDTTRTGVAPRTLMLGIDMGQASRAFPLGRVLEQKLVQDHVGSRAVILVVGPDGKSVRAFDSSIPGLGADADFYRKQKQEGSGLFVDSVTGGEWNFEGCAVSGPATGRCMTAIPSIRDYWFDWHLYHPASTVYSR